MKNCRKSFECCFIFFLLLAKEIEIKRENKYGHRKTLNFSIKVKLSVPETL